MFEVIDMYSERYEKKFEALFEFRKLCWELVLMGCSEWSAAEVRITPLRKTPLSRDDRIDLPLYLVTSSQIS